MASRQYKLTTANTKVDFQYEYLHEQHEIDRVINWLEGRKFFASDFETTGLNPHRDEMVLAQIGDETKQWIIDTRTINIEPLRKFFESSDYVKLGQNYKFDVKFMNKKGWKVKNTADTMLAEQVLRCGLGSKVNMEALAARYLRIDIDKDKELRTSFKTTAVNEFSERQLQYAAGDCIYPVYIARHQKPLIHKRGLRNTLSLEHAVLPVIAKMELAGIRLDTSKWLHLYQEACKEITNATAELDAFFGVKHTIQDDMFGEGKIDEPINYRSWQQLMKELQNRGYFVSDTNSQTLVLAFVHGQLPREFVDPMIRFRIYSKRISSYGTNFIDLIEPTTGHIHSDFTQCFTTTGRLSSTHPNIQNIPRNQHYRNCFIPDDGYVYIIYDFKSIEPRILGDMSLDPTYIDAFVRNKDIYSIIGANIYGEPVSKEVGRPAELRAKAKTGVLGTSYGTGKNKFYDRMLLDMNRDEEGFLRENLVWVDREESDRVWEGIFEACPGIRASLDKSSSYADPLTSNRVIFDDLAGNESFGSFYNKTLKIFDEVPNMTQEEKEKKAMDIARRRGYVTYSASLNGRKRLFRAYHKTWWTDGRNHPIQSTASDIIKTAMVDIAERIEQENHDATILNQAHDELLIQCKTSEAETVNEYVKDLMEGAGNKFLRIVPCMAEGGIKEKWEKD